VSLSFQRPDALKRTTKFQFPVRNSVSLSPFHWYCRTSVVLVSIPRSEFCVFKPSPRSGSGGTKRKFQFPVRNSVSLSFWRPPPLQSSTPVSIPRSEFCVFKLEDPAFNPRWERGFQFPVRNSVSLSPVTSPTDPLILSFQFPVRNSVSLSLRNVHQSGPCRPEFQFPVRNSVSLSQPVHQRPVLIRVVSIPRSEFCVFKL